MTARLITIPFSHYCEKARWALDRCAIQYREEGHLPLFHYLATYRARAGRTVPVVVDGTTVIADSTDIIAWADTKHPGKLLPNDAAIRERALALEDDFDRQLGPATRRWGYFQLLPHRDTDRYMLRAAPTWERVMLRVTRPVAIASLRRSLKITPEGAERSRAKIDETFGRVGELIRDGRRFLAGDAFSVADLTFASLVCPVLYAPEYPIEMPPLDLYTETARRQIEGWRTSPAGRFALRLYADERVVTRPEA